MTIRSVHHASEWLEELSRDTFEACALLRAVLPAVRARLTAGQSARFAAELPIYVRGIYFEGWDPALPTATLSLRELVAQALPAELEMGPDQAIGQVRELLSHRLSPELLAQSGL